MARFALISRNGVVERVIVATPEFFSAVPDFAGYVVREVTYPGEVAVTGDAIETRDAEPGSTWNGTTIARAVAPREKSREEQIEDRIAALEAAERAR